MHTAQGMLVLCSVAAVGLAIGSIKVRGISLGVAGALFAGILFGHLGWNIDPEVRSFVQEFGLILFVYTIGMQVGPSFLASLRRQGLPLNLLAAGIVLMGAALTVVLCHLLGIDLAVGVGLFAGATTNTPALGAAQEALKGLPDMASDRASLPGLGYAVCYPFGILGIILTMILVRAVFRVNSTKELEDFRAAQRAGQESLKRMNLLVDNPNLNGLAIRAVPGLKELGVVISRIRKAGASEVTTVRADTMVNRGDVLLAVGTKANLEKFRVIVGQESPENLMEAPGHVIHRRVVVTHKEVLGLSLRQLALDHVYARQRQRPPARVRHRPVPLVRGPEVGRELSGYLAEGKRVPVDGGGRGHHPAALDPHVRDRPQADEDELHEPLRPPGRQHDRPAGPRFRQHREWHRRAFGGLRDRVPAHDVAAHRRGPTHRAVVLRVDQSEGACRGLVLPRVKRLPQHFVYYLSCRKDKGRRDRSWSPTLAAGRSAQKTSTLGVNLQSAFSNSHYGPERDAG